MTEPIGDDLKRARLILRRTQREAARLLGVSYATYNRWENNHVVPQPDRRQKVLTFINLARKQETNS